MEYKKLGKVAMYVAASGAIAALVDWIGAIDLGESSVAAVTAVGIINLLLKLANDYVGERQVTK